MGMFVVFWFFKNSVKHSWTRHFHSPGLGNPLPHSWPNHWHPLAGLRESTLSHLSPNHLLCRYVFKRSVQISHSSAKFLSSILTIPKSVLATKFLQLDLWFHVVDLSTTDRFLSTSTHYLERWSRNHQYLEICMPQWQVSRLWRQFTSSTFDQRIPWHVRHQHILSHLMDCTEYFESHYHYWWFLSRLLTVYIIDW